MIRLEKIEDETEPGGFRLSLRDLENELLSPLSVDFTSGAMLHRLQTGLGQHQPFSKALGLKSYKGEGIPRVVDATAGLGVDALIMAALGANVTSIERNETIAELLFDGHRRLALRAEELVSEGSATGEKLLAIARRLRFVHASSIDYILALKQENQVPYAIYLDPMYPEEGRAKSALPKKAMQIFRKFVGEDRDVDELFKTAVGSGAKRVIMKRPLSVQPSVRPTHSHVGKTARYDVYAGPIKS